MHPSVFENELVIFDVSIENGECHLRRSTEFGTNEVACETVAMRARFHPADRVVQFG